MASNDDEIHDLSQKGVPDHTFVGSETDIQGANDEALRLRLAAFEEEHRDLDAAISALEIQPLRQSLIIARLKKKKLSIKDQMTRLRDQIVKQTAKTL